MKQWINIKTFKLNLHSQPTELGGVFDAVSKIKATWKHASGFKYEEFR